MNQPIRAGNIALGKIPRVIGTISSPESLADLSAVSRTFPCDIVEIRLDHLLESRWQAACDFIETAGVPVLLTLRLNNEGGKWDKPDQKRLPIFQEALGHVSLIDVEFRSKIVEEVVSLARRAGKVALISYHDFVRTPEFSELAKVVSVAEKFADIVKISTMINRERDVLVLKKLLQRDWKVPVCVIGMGALGAETRMSFPTIGSCFTYGYLDKSAAPGQWSAADLVSQLRERSPEYDRDYRMRKGALSSS